MTRKHTLAARVAEVSKPGFGRSDKSVSVRDKNNPDSRWRTLSLSLRDRPISAKVRMRDLFPMLTDEVEHWYPPQRDVFGAEMSQGSSKHRARVILSPGKFVSRASGENMPDAAATIWLIDHPRNIRIGDKFQLPDNQLLTVRGLETRTLRGGTLSKVYLS